MTENSKSKAALVIGAIVLIAAAAIVVGAVRQQGGVMNFFGAPATPSSTNSTGTVSAPPPGPILSTPTSTSGTSGMKVVTSADNFATIHLVKHQRFLLQLGNSLVWTVSFDPSGVIARVPNLPAVGRSQGVYEATAAGTTTLHASGRPVCKPGQMCATVILEINISFVVGP
jgi:hypothetical protein